MTDRESERLYFWKDARCIARGVQIRNRNPWNRRFSFEKNDVSGAEAASRIVTEMQSAWKIKKPGLTGRNVSDVVIVQMHA